MSQKFPRPRLVAIASGKGGSGKTTLAINLAVALGAKGCHSLVLDLDPRASAKLWAAEANPATTSLPGFSPLSDIVSLHLEQEEGVSSMSEVVSLARANNAALVIADCPSRSDFHTDILLRSADLVLIPTGDSALDHDPTARTLASVLNLRNGEPTPPVLLVPVLEPGLVPSAELRKLPARLTPVIHRDAAFREGLAAPNSHAAEEIATLADFVSAEIGFTPAKTLPEKLPERLEVA